MGACVEPRYTVFVVGGIASGKSTVARLLEQQGALRIDLDELSREVLAPGSPCLEEVADAFGSDLLDEDGNLDRALLAERAFETPGEARRLEAIEMPYIKALLGDRLTVVSCSSSLPSLVAVEVPLLDRVEDMLPLADEVLAVTAPLALRRERAAGRGLSEEDFEARLANQPTDEYLRSKATAVIENDGTMSDLRRRVDWWLATREEAARG